MIAAELRPLRAELEAAEGMDAWIDTYHAVTRHADQVERFVRTAEQGGLTLPGLLGVFYYRSADPRTLTALEGFLPVPIEGLTREFAGGATDEDVCAKTIRTLIDVGARHFYISHLPMLRAQQVLANILEIVGSVRL